MPAVKKAEKTKVTEPKKKVGRPPKPKNDVISPPKKKVGRPKKKETEQKDNIIRDAPGGKPSSGGSNPLNIDPKKILAKKLGFRSGDVTDTDFEESTIDFEDITKAYDADSYVRTGVDKYIDLIWKEGYQITGKNPDAVKYIKDRLAYMSETTDIPIDQFLYDISEDLIKYHNVIIAKSRMSDPMQIPPGYTISGRYGLEPIVGYFVLNCSTFTVKRDKFGTIKQWKQTTADESAEKTFKSDDIIHIYYRREKGELWGKPFLVPVLEDVLSLREAEESILRLIWRNIFPYYHVKVGTEEYPANDTDIEKIEDTIQRMDREGGIVTTHNVEIKAVASDKVIDGEPYLRYWEQRVFTGIGLPEIMFGRGDTANRSTSDSMMAGVTDKIKAYQRVQEMFVNDKIIKELLIEGGYDPILNDEDKVYFKFKENDLDRQQKIENQAILKYEKHAISEDEMREEIGKDPIDLEDQETRDKMYIEVVQKRQAEIEAEFAPTTEANGTSSNKTQPANQHGKKSNAKKTTNTEKNKIIFADEDLLIVDEFFSTKNNVINICKKYFDESNKSKIKIAQETNDMSWKVFMILWSEEVEDAINKTKQKIFELNEISDILSHEKNIFMNYVFDEIIKTIRDGIPVYYNMIDCLNDVSNIFDLFNDNIKTEYYNLMKGVA